MPSSPRLRGPVFFLGLLSVLALGRASPATETEEERPLIQLAILLDTSGSMSGLIEQAKSELWRIVNEFAIARREGKRPDVRVALYEYGNDALSAEQGFIRQISPLTDDLDRISEELFALTTNGGQEYCGAVIQAAARDLVWSGSPETLKTIFIAGNEPFTQGDVDYRGACREAIEKGVTVNTIFCGPSGQGVTGMWKDGALLSDGSYLSINHNQQVAHIPAPQDEEIARLGIELNKTYVPYGALGRVQSERQAAQDTNAEKVGVGSSVQRAACKASHLYRNSSWDLVDAVREKKVEIAELKEEDLPEVLRGKTVEEQRAYLDRVAAERKHIQEKIQALDAERKKHVAEERKKLAKSADETLDSAIIKCVRAQATARNFAFETRPETTGSQ